MRKPTLVWAGALLGAALLAACGDDSGGAAPDASTSQPDAPPGQPDGGTTPDANSACNPVQGTPDLDVEQLADNLGSPVDIKSPPGDARIFIVEQTGKIKVLKNGAVNATPFLDMTGKISCCGERGLLGLAFHPQFATNHRFFIYYTAPGGNVTIAEGAADPANDDVSDGTTPVPEITITHTQFSNHNGGWLSFGPDGYLYAGVGDGGSGGDPNGNGQNLNADLAKIHRFDVDTMPGTLEPAPGNPFIGMANAKATIWLYGVRNPWRDSFDRQTGDLYLADVGQDAFEEVDVIPHGSAGGLNMGWNVMEGDACYSPSTGCDMSGKQLPIYTYSHASQPDGHASITGGYVYRGCKMPGYQGTYFLADEVHDFVRSVRWDGAGGVTDEKEWPQFAIYRVTSFGEDADGELLFVDYDGGRLYRVIPKP
jgi:hypothetical protein